VQVLKPEIGERIAGAAEALFLERGYEGTTMREIARAADVTLSNMYKYYPDKAALFASLMRPFYARTLRDLEALFREKYEMAEDNVFGLVVDAIVSMIKSDRRKFVILMGRSSGTEFAGVPDRVAGMLAEHMEDELPRNGAGEYLVRVLARNFFVGLLAIAERQDLDEELTKQDVVALVRYHFAGMREIR
jgi:AcrR family transcriptional regulator